MKRNTVFFTFCILDDPRTGGDLYNKYLRDFLKDQKDVQIILSDEKDDEIINRPSGTFFINWWFFRRISALPRGSVIIQDQMHRFAFFLANWLIKSCLRSIRIVAMVHETPYQKYTGINSIKNKTITHLFYRSLDCIIVNSEFIAKEAVSLGGRREKIKIRRLPGQILYTNPTSKKKISAEAKVLCVANIRPKKGQKCLIEALKLLRGYELRTTFAGVCKDEGYERELQSLIKEYELENNVRIAGWLNSERMAEAYKECDIFVLPSLYEPWGMVIQEAMHFGLPIVASDTGGIPEQVTHLREALLVPPGDPEALAQAIERLLTDKGLRKKLVKNAYQRLRNMPTWEEVLRYDMSLILSGRPSNIDNILACTLDNVKA